MITGVIEEANAPFDYFIARLPLTEPPNEILARAEQLNLKKRKEKAKK